MIVFEKQPLLWYYSRSRFFREEEKKGFFEVYVNWRKQSIK